MGATVTDDDNRATARRAGRAARATLALILAVGATATTIHVPPAAAAPGTPGVPGAPTVLFAEDFEQGSGITELEAYASVSGATYSADPFWLSAAACNGFILSQAATFPGSPMCSGVASEFTDVRRKAAALGLLNSPQNQSTNRAVSSNTSQAGPNNARQFVSSLLTLPADGRFITFSVDAAATSCSVANNPLLRFFLTTDGGVEIPVSATAINPCTSPGSTSTTVEGAAVRYGRFIADSPVLHTSDALAVTLRNERGNNIGNDGAFDNIRVLDVTPQLDKSFSPSPVATGSTSTLTLTVTNTSELAAKSGWSFTDTLPAGLTVAPAATIGGTCTATVAAPAGAGAVTVTAGQLSAGQASCTITVPVTSFTAGTYDNCAANITSHVGIDLPACASVTFFDPVGLSITKTPTPEVVTGPGQEITYAFVVTNVTGGPVHDVEVIDVQHAPAGALTSGPTCPQSTLAAGAAMTCTATYLATDADVAHGRIDDTATARAVTETGGGVISDEADATVRVEPILTWSLAKSASLDGVPLGDGHTVQPGDTLSYEVVVTSEATVDITGVTLRDDLSAVLDDATFVSGSAELTIDGGAPAAVSDPVGTELTIGPFTLPVGAVAVVTYDVTVDDDAWSRTLANSVTGTAGTPDDPRLPEPCDEECSTTQVTPALVQVLKVGEDAAGDVVPMDGSTWAIYDAADATVAVIDPLPAAESGGTPLTGRFRATTLAAGTYWLEETTALPGFELLAERVEFSIAPGGEVALAAGTSAHVSLVDLDGAATIRVEDVPSLDLPEAGGPGEALFLAVGGALLAFGILTALLLRTTRVVRKTRATATPRDTRSQGKTS